jgi:probable blue pigment (indigoidine) exporter
MAAAAGAAVGFGVSYPMTAVALRSWAPLGAAAVQGTLALGLIAVLAVIGVLPRPVAASWSRRGLVRLAVLGLLGGVVFIAGMNAAVALAGPTIAGFVATLYAVIAALLAVPILGERLRAGTVVSFLVAMLGTLLLAGFQPLEGSVLGIAFGLVAALGFGLYLVLARRWTVTAGLDGTSITMANMIGRGPVMLAAQLAIDPAGVFPGQVQAASAVAMVGLVLLPSMLSQLLIIASVKRVAARRTGSLLLLTPLTSAAVSALILGERATPQELLGGALVVAGIAGASGAIGAVSQRLLPGPADRRTRSA